LIIIPVCIQELLTAARSQQPDLEKQQYLEIITREDHQLELSMVRDEMTLLSPKRVMAALSL
jgi:hypothetical protein